MQAVSETAGEVLRYDGVLIEPLYHASCGGGCTEDAEEVWGNAKPYLVSVACNHSTDPHTGAQTTMSLQQMEQKMGVDGVAAVGNFGDFMQLLSSTASDRVKSLRIGNETFSGTQLRSALGLKSSLVSWKIDGDEITVYHQWLWAWRGFMPVWQPIIMQEQNNTYQQILSRYYPGTQLSKE